MGLHGVVKGVLEDLGIEGKDLDTIWADDDDIEDEILALERDNKDTELDSELSSACGDPLLLTDQSIVSKME